VEADTAIIAIGQRAELGFLQGMGMELDGHGWIKVDEETGQTSIENLFAGGDVASGPATVIAAIADGKRVACGIDRYLRGDKAKQVCFRTPADLEGEERYHPPHVPREERVVMPQAPTAERTEDFCLVELGLDEEAALAEARRCLACSLCANCNACLDTFACPALFLDGEGKIAIDETLCDNCGLCLQLCSNDAIAEVEVVKEEQVGA
jgi:Pyruvate/2-oxoacid:ferredoxin oxidoreductase delta subunit